MKPILEVINVSKKFRLHHESAPYLNFREQLVNLVTFKKSKSADEDFWALKDVNFTVEAGESVGIIGKNGAGKSTILKILSKITPPTSGKIIGRGRIASLLEVGTGFHQELTGRENIYLNGSILGMKKREIDLHFDEIVDFSGTERFLDTPLKHYSSGMQLRLAFSVAAFLEPEILIIDEVLAVGDAEFQKKCIGKMEDVSRSGRTILFVSHNMMAIESLCKKSILLSDGRVVAEGPSPEIVKEYLKIDVKQVQARNLTGLTRRQGNAKVRFRSIRLASLDNSSAVLGKKLDFVLELEGHEHVESIPIHLAITIFNRHNSKLITLDNLYSNQKVVSHAGSFEVACSIPLVQLMPGQYRVDLWCADTYETYDLIEEAYTLSVESADIFGTGKIHNEAKHGNFIVENNWSNLT
jgi:lipopolysaccharide transport system ATP-binding protein